MDPTGGQTHAGRAGRKAGAVQFGRFRYVRFGSKAVHHHLPANVRFPDKADTQTCRLERQPPPKAAGGRQRYCFAFPISVMRVAPAAVSKAKPLGAAEDRRSRSKSERCCLPIESGSRSRSRATNASIPSHRRPVLASDPPTGLCK